MFAREGIPLALATVIGTHFTAYCVEDGLKNIGCKYVFTATRKPGSNGQIDNFVRTLKEFIEAQKAPTISLFTIVMLFIVRLKDKIY